MVRQNGLLLCTINGCVDNPLAWDRDRIIQEVIAGAPEEMQVAGILKETDANDVDSAEST